MSERVCGRNEETDDLSWGAKQWEVISSADATQRLTVTLLKRQLENK